MSEQFSFNALPNRRLSHSIKWNIPEGELPFWIADMDFPTAPCIQRALEARLEKGVYGYTCVPDEWYEAYRSWWGTRHAFSIEKEWLTFCTGAIPLLACAVRELSAPGDEVLVLSPTYNHFYQSIENNGRTTRECPLLCDGERYAIDWPALEAAMADPKVSLMIFCNPQNPVGRIWTEEELARVGELAAAHGVLVISDEIHCDLVAPGRAYVPFARVSETNRRISVTVIAPSKAFNIAGLQTSAFVVPDRELRRRLRKAIDQAEVALPSAFAAEAAIAALTEGGLWLDALREYLEENKKLVLDTLREQLPEVSCVYPEATYLMWLNVGNVTDNSPELSAYLRENAKIFLSDGLMYRGEGNRFLRMNIACPREMLREGLKRLVRGVHAYEVQHHD